MTKRRSFLKFSALAVPAIMLNWNPARSAINSDDPDWNNIREAFDLDKDLVFLNNGTIGPSPRIVTDAVVASMREVNSKATYGGWEAAVKVIAEYFGAAEEEICLTHNVTDGINIIAQGLPLKEGDEIIVSNQEHVGNALPWLSRAKRDKLSIRVLDLTLPDEELLKALRGLIGPKTRVIALPHIPCTTGRIIPIQKIGELAKEKKLFYFLDGAHGAGMLDLDFSQMNCDFYATCTHKWLLGPKGTGFLYIRKDALKSITPIFTGAGSDTGWNLIDGNPRILDWSELASRHLNGTQNRALYDGVIAAINFHQKLGKKAIAKRIVELNDILYTRLININDITILTPEKERAGLCSFRFKNHDYMDFQRHCSERNIIIRAVPENEINAIRVSTHIYTTIEEIDTFVRALNDYLGA